MDDSMVKPIFDEEGLKANAKIKVIGVGGGGSNAINEMIKEQRENVEYWVFNTDSQALANSVCENKLVLGRNVTKGLGAGGLPERGKEAATDSYEDIKLVVNGADMVFIACGEGGGTGTGGAPLVAKAAKETGSLVLGIVTRPFTFEGKKRQTNAFDGINELRKYVDALIIVSNDKLMFNNGSMHIQDAFAVSDQVLASSVSTVTDLILKHGIINLDFADVKATLSNKGFALIGIGLGEGKDKATMAANNAVNSALLETSIKGSKTMIINFSVGSDTSLNEIQDAIEFIKEASGVSDDDNNTDIIFGVQQDDELNNKMKVAIIATGFSEELEFNNTPQPSSKQDFKQIDTTIIKPEESRAYKEKKEREESFTLPNYLKSLLGTKDEVLSPSKVEDSQAKKDETNDPQEKREEI